MDEDSPVDDRIRALEQRARGVLDGAVAAQCEEARAAARQVRAAGQLSGVMREIEELYVASAPGAQKFSEELLFRSTRAELASSLHVSEHHAEQMMSQAERVGDFPKFFAAFEAGEVTARHLGNLLREVGLLDPEHFPEVDELATVQGRRVSPAKLGKAVRRFVDKVQAPTREIRHAAARERRNVTIRPMDDGMALVEAYVPEVAAVAALDRLTRIAKADEQETTALGKLAEVLPIRDDGLVPGSTVRFVDPDAPDSPVDVVVGGEPAPSDTLPETFGEPGRPGASTRDQRRADAFIDLLIDGEVGFATGIRPEVLITVPMLTLLGQSDEPATLRGRSPIDQTTARKLLGQATSFTRVLTDPVDGALLDIDRQSYAVTAAMRRFLGLRDGTCTFPGCNEPAVRIDVDHITEWAFGGQTNLRNLQCLCRRHHTLKTETRWEAERLRDGTMQWTTPLGLTYIVDPENPERWIADDGTTGTLGAA